MNSSQNFLFRGKSGFISLVLLLSFLAYLSVRQSFNLAQGGDDWGIHWLIWGIFDKWNEAVYYNPLTYFCTYCPHYFFLSIISKFFGYEHFYYFLANFIARVIAGLGIFFLLKKITSNLLIAILASCFFVVTYIGIEATDWAFNYNHILGIAFVTLFLIWYFKTKNTFNYKNLSISALFFAAAAIVSPPRMHGLLPLLVIAEFGWWIIEGKKFNVKKSLLRILIMSITNYAVLYGISDIYILIRDHLHFEIGPYFIGNGYAAHGWNEGRMKDGIKLMLTWFSQGRSDFIVDPIATLGNYVMPDMLTPLFGKPILNFFPPITLVYGGLTYLIVYLAGIKPKITLAYIISISTWLFSIYFLWRVNLNTFSYPRVVFSIIGGFTIILSIYLFFILKKTWPIIAHITLLSLGWMFTFTLFPWVISPYAIINSWGRYSIQQAAGLSIWMAVIFLIVINSFRTKRKFFALGITYLAVLVFIFMHIKFSNDYLGYVATYRSKELDTLYWNIITSETQSLDKNGLNIFLMLTDQDSSNIAEAIRFGFGARSTIYFDITMKDFTPFMVVNEYENILSSVYDGKYLPKQGRPLKPTTINRVFAFALQNKQMYNITDQVRQKLTEDLKALKKGTRPPPQITL